MDTIDLQKIAERNRRMREAGFALLFASGVLAVFLFVPLAPRTPSAPAEMAVATSTAPNAYADMPIEAKAAIVYDLALGQTLYEKNADAQLPLASLTKLLTVYAALAEMPSSAPVTITAEALRVEGPRAFSKGQTFALADLARLTLVASLNDGAAAIASAVAKRLDRPSQEVLAAAAAALGLPQTYAVNGSGLDANAAISGGYGSARDLARLAGAIVHTYPDIASATTKPFAEASAMNGVSFKVKNTDPMVDTIPGLLLSKTGYTDLAGGNLAIVFDAAIGHPVAVVVLGSSVKERFTDAATLIAASFAHFAGVKSL